MIFLHKTKVAVGVVASLAVILSSPALQLVSATDNTIILNPEPVTLEDGVVLTKTATAVPGEVNAWDVTLSVERPGFEVTSDTVMAIDISGSMNDDGKLDQAKAAAKALAARLLPEGNTTNRIALLYFNASASSHAFEKNYTTVANQIDRLTAKDGTFTQDAVHLATGMLKVTHADVKNTIILSDGIPTLNYQIDYPDNYLIDGGPGLHSAEKQTGTDIPQEAFLYGKRKTGGNNTAWKWYNTAYLDPERTQEEWHYYNSGNCAIAEAGYYKTSGLGDLYTIALNVDEYGEDVLSKMASPDKYYTADTDNLTGIFDEIAGKITALVQSASVDDKMTSGMVIPSKSKTDVSETDKLHWEPEFTYDTTTEKYKAEITYRVEATEDILGNVDENGYVAISEKTTIAYDGDKTAEFPEPKVKPYAVNMTKNLAGQTCEGCRFEIEMIFPDGTKHVYELGADETRAIVRGLLEGGYSVREVGTNNNATKFSDYVVEYSLEGFDIDASRDEFVNIAITNTYMPADESEHGGKGQEEYSTEEATKAPETGVAEQANGDATRNNLAMVVLVVSSGVFVAYAVLLVKRQ